MLGGGDVSSELAAPDWFVEVRCYWGLATIGVAQPIPGVSLEDWDEDAEA